MVKYIFIAVLITFSTYLSHGQDRLALNFNPSGLLTYSPVYLELDVVVNNYSSFSLRLNRLDINKFGSGYDDSINRDYEYFFEHKGLGLGAYYKYRILGASIGNGLFIGAGLDLIKGTIESISMTDNNMGSSSRSILQKEYLVSFSVPLSYRKQIGNVFIEGSITLHFDDKVRGDMLFTLRKYESINSIVRPNIFPGIALGYIL